MKSIEINLRDVITERKYDSKSNFLSTLQLSNTVLYEKKNGSNLIAVTLQTVYGKFKGVGTNQKIAKINAVKLADDCFGNG